MDTLVVKLRAEYASMMKKVSRCKLPATRREKLWVLFHRFSLKNGIQLCIECERALDLTPSAQDTFWQLVMEKEFLNSLELYEKSRSRPTTASSSSPTSTSVSSPGPSSSASSPQSSLASGSVNADLPSKSLSFVEQNAVRHTAGYVLRKLESKYSQSKQEQSSVEILRALREMGGKLSERSTDQSSQSTRWTRLINRGGLYFVSDAVYDLFVTIEHTVDDQLTSIFNERGKGIEKVKMEKLSWVSNDDDVKEMWRIVSTAIESEEASKCLLKEIIHLWITIRGHSKTRKIKEDYNKAKKQTVKGKRSLRKDLKKTTDDA